MHSVCTKCRINPRKLSNGGYRTWCLDCNKQAKQLYNKLHADKVKKREKEYKRKNTDKIKSQHKTWKQDNIIKYKVTMSKYRQSDKYKQWLSNYRRDYRKSVTFNNLNNMLSRNLRGRLSKAIKNNYKSGSAVNDLGCSINELKTYLQELFDGGMVWENYGRGLNKWGIDHMAPLDSFDLSKRGQLLEACHYTNLQPLWNSDNSRKCNRV